MRNISNIDIANANRLKRLWDAKKKPLELVQTEVARSMGITQSAVSHLLHARMALTTDLVLAWSKVLQVQPAEIDPGVGKKIALINNEQRISRRIYILSSTDQTKPLRKEIETFSAGSPNSYGIEVKKEVDGAFSKGDILILDPGKKSRIGSKIAVKINNGYSIGKLHARTSTTITILSLNTHTTTTHQLADIWHYHTICGVEYN